MAGRIVAEGWLVFGRRCRLLADRAGPLPVTYVDDQALAGHVLGLVIGVAQLDGIQLLRAMLDQARMLGLPCAVASSSERPWVEGWLDLHNIKSRFA